MQNILNNEFESLKKEIEELNSKKRSLKIINDKKIEKLKNELILLNSFIKESIKKQNFYKDKNIEKLLQELSNENIYKQKEKSLKIICITYSNFIICFLIDI
jgi:hypothetical protein